MSDPDLIRLMALDEEDLAVLSAHLQDAVLKVADIRYLDAERRLVVAVNRFAWESANPTGRWRNLQRRRSVLSFDRVSGVRSTGIARARGDDVLSLLAVRFEPAGAPSGAIVLDFAGGATLRAAVECVEARLADLGPTWSTDAMPRHRTD